MRSINIRKSFEAYLSGQKQIEIIEEPVNTDNTHARQLLELVKLYRQQEKIYFDKVKRREFAKDELHFLKKTQEKLDNLLQKIQL